jgi:hypothetical protein
MTAEFQSPTAFPRPVRQTGITGNLIENTC